MPIFGTNNVLQESRWTAFKAIAITAKGLPIQYEDLPAIYDIYALDGLVVYRAQIFKGSVPLNSDYSQGQNDSDKADFETNYLSLKTNQPLGGNVRVSSVVFNNSTVTTSGSTIIPNLTAPSVTLLINVKNAPTGTTPSITFSIQDIDPVDLTSVLGSATTGAALTSASTQELNAATQSSAVKVSWTVTGGTPSFTGVNVSLSQKSSVVNVTVSGASTVTANQGTANSIGNSWPVEMTDGTNVLGTTAHPVRTDPTGSTTQPVSQATAANLNATVTQGPAATLAGYWTVRVTDGTNTMPTGDAVARAIFHKLTDGTNTAAVKAASTAAVATDPALVVAISPNNTVAATQSGTWTVTQGTAAAAGAPWAMRLSDGTAFYDGTKTDQLPAALVGGRLDANVGTWLGSTAPTVGSKTSANSIPVVVASDQGAVPVSGTVTANIGTTNGLALDATLTGGTAKAIVRGGAKGATTAADVTNTAEGTDHQALDVQIYHGGTAKDPTAIRALTSADVVTAAQGTAAALAGYWPVRITDGTNTLPTGDAVGRAIFEKITDGTNTAAVKAASTAAVATDPALVVAISPNNTVPVSAASLPLPTGAATAANQTTLGSQTTKLNDGTNTAAVKAASTAAVATDPALVVAISPNNAISVGPVTVSQSDITGTGTLNALNATASITLAGSAGAGMQLLAGTLVGTIVPEISNDGGTTWVATFFEDPTTGNKVSNIVFGASNTATTRTIVTAGGVSTARVRVSAFTSGTATCNLRASSQVEPTNLATAPAGGAAPPVAVAVQGIAGGTSLPVTATQATAANLNATVVQGTAASIANSWRVQVTDLTNTMPTMDVAARKGFMSITDGTNTMPTGDVVGRAIFEKITDGTNTAAVKAASTAAVAADPALVVAISPNNVLNPDLTASGALGALNAAVQVSTAGLQTAGFQLAAGTLVGTIVGEVSLDGGTTWNSTYLDTATNGKVSTIVFGSANTATAATIVGIGGSGLTRIRVSAYTSGTANITLRATTRTDPSVLFAGPLGVAVPPSSAFVGGYDGTNLIGLRMKAASTAAVATDPALVVAISPNNTIAATQSGTWTVTQGTAASLANAWSTKITDATNGPVAVKAASTAAVAADPALVVSLSPNSPVKSTVKPLYGTNNQALTITIASLTNTSARASTSVDNTTNLFEDVLFFVKVTSAAAATSATGYVNIFGYATVDGGTTYSESITGTDAAITLTVPPNLVLLAQINVVANGVTYRAGPYSFCRTYGLDRLPARWGIVLQNASGATLNATAGNHAILYQGINGQLA